MTEDSVYQSRTVTAHLSIGETTVPLSRIVLRHTVDELPTAELTLQLDNRSKTGSAAQGSVEMSVEKFRKLAQLFQEKILNNYRLSPDVRLTLAGSTQEVLTFNGFLGKPEVVIREGQVDIVVTMVHAKAAVQAWTGQIYNYVEPYAMPTLVDAYGESASPEAQAAAEGESISMKMFALVEYAMGHVKMEASLDDPMEYDMLPVHLLNQKAVSLVKEVLRASKSTTVIEGTGDPEFDAGNVNQVLFDILRNSPNFWSILKAMGQVFLFQINADWKGNLWMEPVRTLDDPGQRVIAVPLSQLRFNAAHIYELPILQVIVIGDGPELFATAPGELGTNQGATPPAPIPQPGADDYAGRISTDGELWTSLQCLAKYPTVVDRSQAGNFYVLRAPSWVNADTITDAQVEHLSQSLKQGGSRFDLFVEAQPEVKNLFLRQQKPRRKVLQHMAKQLFESLYLGSTFASITIPFDVRPCAGRTYTVKDTEGNGVFVGFLRDVTHSVALSADGGAEAVTHLMFTHIKVVGAALKQLFPSDNNAASTNLGARNIDKTYTPPDSVQA